LYLQYFTSLGPKALDQWRLRMVTEMLSLDIGTRTRLFDGYGFVVVLFVRYCFLFWAALLVLVVLFAVFVFCVLGCWFSA